MAYEYFPITDPTWEETNQELGESDYILVKPKDYSHVPIGIPNWEPQPCCMSELFKNWERELHQFEVKPDDVWVATYPKNGTTWTQEMVWLICNGLDFEKARNNHIRQRFPFLEISTMISDRDSFGLVRNMASPRFIKTHLPVGLLPPQIWSVKPKIVHVKRNPKSVAVSYYHHSKNIHYKGSLDQFIHSFKKDLQYYSPYHNHVIEYHELQNYENILYLSYEDMKRDLRSSILETCHFFGETYTDEQIEQLCQHLSFDSMKANNKVNYTDEKGEGKFMRQGTADGWKRELSVEQITEIDCWTEDVVEEKYRYLFDV
ncbi:luciferin sulfotransferase-like [Uranotaenia lowii]|uniref:luciferin sulfotransferase-like n=1 Tax=Uranotaenia lowii TaxID=190385 RepID=UPI0024797927|nr:luciferin sulfotransferase-like [Uranotaenia lowii]XP_055611863.1 luciferin sulfotransferase-like [Uranotaenia lowii]